MKLKMAFRLILLSLQVAMIAGCGVLKIIVERQNTNVANCIPTPRDVESFYIPNAPFRSAIYPEAIAGQRLIISGVIYASDCLTPLPDAVVDVWQAGIDGEYDFSDQFHFRGQVVTNADGRYEFETIMPGGDPPHIYFKISRRGSLMLMTQIYFEGKDNQGANPTLIIPLTRDGDVLRGTFDIVLVSILRGDFGRSFEATFTPPPPDSESSGE